MSSAVRLVSRRVRDVAGVRVDVQQGGSLGVHPVEKPREPGSEGEIVGVELVQEEPDGVVQALGGGGRGLTADEKRDGGRDDWPLAPHSAGISMVPAQMSDSRLLEEREVLTA